MARKLASAWIALVLICTPFFAFAENHYCVTADQGVFLVSESGSALDLSSAWSDLYCVSENALYAVGLEKSGKMRYALCDVNGRLLTEPIYASLSAMQGGVLFYINGAYGWMDVSGSEMIPSDYTQLVSAGEDTFYALLTNPNDDQADQIYLVDKKNRSTATGVWTTVALDAVSDARMPFCEEKTALYGYLDDAGQIAIPPQFEYAGAFSNGLADAVSGEKHGLIDTSGAWVLAPEYSYIYHGDGFYIALTNSCCTVFDADGKTERFRLEEPNLEVAAVGSAVVVIGPDSLRVFNRDGALLHTYTSAVSVVEGVKGQLLVFEGDWGSKSVHIIDSDGKQLERADQHLIPLDETHYVFVTMNTALYNSNLLGGTRYSVNYESLQEGMIDSNGNEIIPAEYSEIRALGIERYLLISENALTIVDAGGNAIWQKTFAEE